MFCCVVFLRFNTFFWLLLLSMAAILLGSVFVFFLLSFVYTQFYFHNLFVGCFFSSSVRFYEFRTKQRILYMQCTYTYRMEYIPRTKIAITATGDTLYWCLYTSTNVSWKTCQRLKAALFYLTKKKKNFFTCFLLHWKIKSFFRFWRKKQFAFNPENAVMHRMKCSRAQFRLPFSLSMNAIVIIVPHFACAWKRACALQQQQKKGITYA